jgi:hypothetical protein
LVAYEARDKSRDYLKLMTESTRKVAALLEAVKKENDMLKAKISEFASNRIRLPPSKRRYDVVCALHFIVLYV